VPYALTSRTLRLVHCRPLVRHSWRTNTAADANMTSRHTTAMHRNQLRAIMPLQYHA